MTYAEILRKAEEGNEVQILTVLDGPEAGAKLTLINGEPVDKKGESTVFHDLSRFSGIRTGILCVHDIRVFSERFGEAPELVILGAGHVGQALTRIMKLAGFFVTVIEDRPEFAALAEKAGADRVLVGEFDARIRQLPERNARYYAVMTRGHQYDICCLKEILKKDSDYIGMMGSRKRTALVKEELIRCGYSAADADSIHAPIGLKIGAETPEEIAVSVAAELISVRRKENRSSIPEAVCSLFEAEQESAVCVCTIVSRHGSAPRSVGTKMAVSEEKTAATIGGGSAEAEVISLCRELIRKNSGNIFRTVQLSVNNAEAVDGGMACGGSIEVLIETI